MGSGVALAFAALLWPRRSSRRHPLVQRRAQQPPTAREDVSGPTKTSSESGASLQKLDQRDPGGSRFRSEWARPGELVFEEHTRESGLLRVYSTPASSGGAWRRLRFEDRTDQSVILLDAQGEPAREALAFGYLKTLAAVGVCTARALGRSSPLRVLMLGGGGGALPGWFASKLGAAVDAVELDGAVLRAATQAMGLPSELVRQPGSAAACVLDAATRDLSVSPVAVYHCDGAEFVLEAARARRIQYDIAILDVFDDSGKTPEVFVGREVSNALGSLAECAVANLSCPVAMWEDATEFNAPQAGSLARAWRSGFGAKAGCWSVRVAEGQNIVLAVTHVGAPPEECLESQAMAAANEGAFAFDPVRRVSFHRREF